jgi:hypothetical protein
MARRDDRPTPDASELFWDLDEPLEPVEAAGGGRVFQDSLAAEEEAGHAWQAFFAEPTDHGHRGSDGRGDFEPHGGDRFRWGRETAFSPDGERDFRVYGEHHGREGEGHGDRRRPYRGATGDEGERLPQVGPHTGRGPRSYRRSDERIRDELYRRLTAESWLDASDVELAVSDGEVTLTGSVDSRRSRRLAEDIAAAVPGVKEVTNRLRAGEGPRRAAASDH